jgi:hypothetical protein
MIDDVFWAPDLEADETIQIRVYLLTNGIAVVLIEAHLRLLVSRRGMR